MPYDATIDGDEVFSGYSDVAREDAIEAAKEEAAESGNWSTESGDWTCGDAVSAEDVYARLRVTYYPGEDEDDFDGDTPYDRDGRQSVYKGDVLVYDADTACPECPSGKGHKWVDSESQSNGGLAWTHTSTCSRCGSVHTEQVDRQARPNTRAVTWSLPDSRWVYDHSEAAWINVTAWIRDHVYGAPDLHSAALALIGMDPATLAKVDPDELPHFDDSDSEPDCEDGEQLLTWDESWVLTRKGDTITVRCHNCGAPVYVPTYSSIRCEHCDAEREG